MQLYSQSLPLLLRYLLVRKCSGARQRSSARQLRWFLSGQNHSSFQHFQRFEQLRPASGSPHVSPPPHFPAPRSGAYRLPTDSLPPYSPCSIGPLPKLKPLSRDTRFRRDSIAPRPSEFQSSHSGFRRHFEGYRPAHPNWPPRCLYSRRCPERRAAARPLPPEYGTGFDFGKASGHISKQQRRLLVAQVRRNCFDGVQHMTLSHKDVLPSIVVVVHEPGAPARVGQRRPSHSRTV